jgi:hypothetical protein
MYVWYHTEHFQFRPIDPRSKEDGEIRQMAQEVLAWQEGAELRGPHRPEDLTSRAMREAPMGMLLADRELREVAKLGPWAEPDKLMLRALASFKAAEVGGSVGALRCSLCRDVLFIFHSSSVSQQPPDRLVFLPLDPSNSTPNPPRCFIGLEPYQAAGKVAPPDPIEARDNVRIVFGLMIHDDARRFKALWEVLFSEEHYVVLHVARGAAGQGQGRGPLRRAVREVIEATPVRDGSVWDRVLLLDEEWSFEAMWGDITLGVCLCLCTCGGSSPIEWWPFE